MCKEAEEFNNEVILNKQRREIEQIDGVEGQGLRVLAYDNAKVLEDAETFQKAVAGELCEMNCNYAKLQLEFKEKVKEV